MNYKETFYFISACLTISLEEKNRKLVEKKLKSNHVDWDSVVKISTSHYVFPALYCNLKRVDFLHYLPEDLVSYMKYITDLNRERNEQIIKQAKALNNYLLSENITPIFLKGTANLLADLYDDIAERMVGDIDFLFSKEEYPKAITVLKEFGYSEVIKTTNSFPAFKHYDRLNKEKNIAAIEIHKELLIEKYANEFNYNFVQQDLQLINKFTLLSYGNMLNLSIIANQINDDRFLYKTIGLRNAYDVFLLSKKTNLKEAVGRLVKLKEPLYCFLAACNEVFNTVDSLQYIQTKKTAVYLRTFKNQFENVLKTKRKHSKLDWYLFFQKRSVIIYKSFFDKKYRIWLFKKLTDKNWQREKLNKIKS